MKSLNLVQALALGSVFVLSGCTVRTYTVAKDRVDQNLTSGNRGYLMGSGPAGEERQRPTTRTTKVVEIELRSPMKTEKQKPARKVVTETSIQEEVISPEGQDYFSEDLMTETVETEAAPSVSFEKYTVQKNDTLQKISQKYYGTSKKYLKIYEANKDTLKGPDKIRPGQVLKIPVTSRNTLMEEPQENLK